MLQIKFRSPTEIGRIADGVRLQHGVNDIPIDVEYVLDVKLGMDIVPVPGLRDRMSGDAFAARDWSAIYYDPSPVATRIRYSMAHELGHYVLHRTEIDALPPTTDIDDWATLYGDLPSEAVGAAETQANMFAAAFLMPGDLVTARFEAATLELEAQRLRAISAPARGLRVTCDTSRTGRSRSRGSWSGRCRGIGSWRIGRRWRRRRKSLTR